MICASEQISVDRHVLSAIHIRAVVQRRPSRPRHHRICTVSWHQIGSGHSVRSVRVEKAVCTS